MEEKIAARSNEEWLNATYDKLLVKMKAECTRVGTNIPYTTGEDGKYHDITETPWGRTPDGKTHVGFWTNGFWPGMLWQMYEATGDEDYKKAAVGVEERLEELLRSAETVDHDAGFCSFCPPWPTTERPGIRRPAAAAFWQPAFCPPAIIWTADSSGHGLTPWPR